MRKNGKFIGTDGSIPEGQGIVMAHLSECHELVEMVCGFNCYSAAYIMLELTPFLYLMQQLKEAMEEGDDGDEGEEIVLDDEDEDEEDEE